MLFERQKALLALLDATGGRVGNLDFQKLLFLYCRDADEPPFDFVPYRFGAFSFTSHADRRKLVEAEMLKDDDKHWDLTPVGRAAVNKEVRLRERARSFASQAPSLRGDDLVALTYRRYPYFATRSEIATRVLADDPKALERIAAVRPPRGTPGIVTLGYEGRSVEGYLDQMLRDGVTLLCDVRRNPLSRRYGFAKKTLANGCENVGIRYEHLPELGIASSERKGLETQADYDALFETYERTSLPRQGAALARIRAWVVAGERVALTCFERLPHQCHRHCVAEALERAFGAAYAPKHL